MGGSRSDKIGLIATVKDEGPWLVEWIAHNHVLGFDQIAVASNDCTDGTDKILDRMQAMGLIIHQPNPGPYHGSIQLTAYQRLQEIREMRNCKWLISLDVDEFLVIYSGDGTLDNLVPLAEGADQLPIRWRVFGDSGLRGVVPPPVTQKFVMCEPPFEVSEEVGDNELGQYKTFVRTHHRLWVSLHFATSFKPFTRYSPLRFLSNTFWCNGNVVALRPSTRQKEIARNLDMAGGNCEIAQINHYSVKTREICALKQARGDAVRDNRDYFSDNYFENWNRNQVKDTSIAKYDKQVSALCKQWLLDAELRKLHDDAMRVLEARIARLTLPAA